MIDVGSGAYPVLADYNGDGLLDLFVSNYGYYMYSTYLPGLILNSVFWSNIALYENTGTVNNPKFTAVTHDFASLHQLHQTALYPTFGDLDGDNDLDMICGHKNGGLLFFENIAGIGNPMDFGEPENDYFNINVGALSAPQLFDLDNDGRLDLIIGEEEGNLNYYRNIGSANNPEFSFVTDSLGKINVTNPNLSYYGYSTPYFFTPINGTTQLLVGSEQGKVFYYKGIDGNLSGAFVENDSLFTLIGEDPIEWKRGIRVGAVIADLNEDTFMELIVGNYSGGLHFYQSAAPPQVSEVKKVWIDQIKMHPNPVNQTLWVTIPKDSDGNVFHFEIYNVLGKLMIETLLANSGENLIDVSSFGKGVYIAKIFKEGDAQRSYIQKFVKQ